MTAVIEPNGCALCGAPERGHALRYGGAHLRHSPKGYVAPTDRVRLARMLHRRELVRRATHCCQLGTS